MKKQKAHLNLVGVAGEYFVAAELSQRGIVATLTLKNTPRIDVIATNLETGIVANIQVKTMSIDNPHGWHLNESDEKDTNFKNHFYVLVNLMGTGAIPEFIIIPQRAFSRYLRNDYQEYITVKKKDGTERKRTTMRIFDPYRRESPRKFAKKYINNWNILGFW